MDIELSNNATWECTVYYLVIGTVKLSLPCPHPVTGAINRSLSKHCRGRVITTIGYPICSYGKRSKGYLKGNRFDRCKQLSTLRKIEGGKISPPKNQPEKLKNLDFHANS